MMEMLRRTQTLSVRRRSVIAALAALTLTAGQLSIAQAQTAGLQKPEIAESVVVGQESADKPKAKLTSRAFQAGPTPVWIWGDSASKQYLLRKEFEGTLKSAWVRATCDNEFTLRVNGKRVTSSSTWEAPTTVDVTAHLKPGRNVLEAQVANEGNVAGFVLKLIGTKADDSEAYVVTDDSWQASVVGQSPPEWKAVATHGKLGVAPWRQVFNRNSAPANSLRDIFVLQPGFQVEQLYEVPKGDQGSWVSIAFDNKGRIIASDQGNKGLYRITPGKVGTEQQTKIEKLNIPITSAQGMLYAFDSLYICVNGGPGSGLYRARDTTGDDQYDELTKLKSLRGGGEHGPHALRLSPDGESIYLIAGNHTDPPEGFNSSRIPSNWSEDHLLPRRWDARGHARGKLAPGGWIARTDPDGKTWEIFSVGYRNPYDMDFNADGELFAYDADMEWDMGMPWYRPTRVVHAMDGSEFGWRSGTGKWPTYYADSVPEVVDIGPGSPVGVAFGYGTHFPAKYQKALYLCDWTFGTMYAIHLKPSGATYTATKEEFLSRTPLPLTDVAIGPDGAMYFTIGGRGTQSALFRVTYVGDESTEKADYTDDKFAELRGLRHELEAMHYRMEDAAAAVSRIWPHLGHKDRAIRYAARIALEQQDVTVWQERALKETNPQTLVNAAIALARQGKPSVQGPLLDALSGLKPDELFKTELLDLIRAYSLVFTRLGKPTEAQSARIAAVFSPLYPAKDDDTNRELCQLLVYLEAPGVVSRTLALLQADRKVSPEDMSKLLARNAGYGGTISSMLANLPDAQKLYYAFVLRNASKGWTPQERVLYFRWLNKAQEWNGGASFRGFIDNMSTDSYENSTDRERLVVEASGARKAYQPPALPKAQGPGRAWKMEDLLAAQELARKGRNFENGKKMFAAARCVICHRFGGDGGATGPDLTQAAGRFSYKDMCESLVDPSKIISDQYRASIVVTNSGKVHTGRIVSETKDGITMLLDPEDATKVIDIKRSDIDELTASPVSLMPKNLLEQLNEQEVLDLLAYLLSRGNPQDPAFKK